MGYYTDFSLDVQKSVQDENSDIAVNKMKYIEALHNIVEALHNFDEDSKYALDEKGGTLESVKWYSYQESLLKFSKFFPDWVIILSGVGEEVGDFWREYFLNGKSIRVKGEVVFEEPDLKLLI